MSTTHVVPVGQPLPGASLGQATKRFFRGYIRFSGCASRSEFWWAMLAVWLISLVPLVPLMVLAVTMSGWSQPGGMALVTPEQAQWTLYAYFGLLAASVLCSLVMAIPTFSVMWRRVQDANFHGAWILLSFVGLSIVPFVMCFFPSNPAGARFGPAHPAQTPYGFAHGAHSYDSPAALRQQQYGTRTAYPAAQQQYAPPAQQYGAHSYGGASYGGASYGQPQSGQRDEWQS